MPWLAQGDIAGRQKLNASGSIVQFENVGLRYGTGAETLSDLAFSLREGGFYFLTGPSGAGKTSLLKLLYLALAPEPRPDPPVRRGHRHHAACPPAGLPAADRRRLPGFPAGPAPSTFDNVALPLEVAGVEDKDLEDAGQRDAGLGRPRRPRQRPPATLSGGEQQRVAIARAGDRPARAARSPTSRPATSIRKWRRRLLFLFDSPEQARHDGGRRHPRSHLLTEIGRAEMLRLDRGQISDPTGAAAQPAAEGGFVRGGVRKFGAAERGLLPEGRLAGPMPWVIAIMMFLTVLAAAAGLGLAGAASRLDDQIGGRVTIQVVEANPARREAQARAAAAAIEHMPGVVSVRAVPESENRGAARALARRRRARGGSAGAGAGRRRPDAEGHATLDEMRQAVGAAAPGARIDDNGQRLAPLASLIGALKWLAAGLVLLMVGRTAATVVLAARAALDTHRGTIEILHLMGATDVQVARLFQRRIALDALFGGLVGFILAALRADRHRRARLGLGSELLGSARCPRRPGDLGRLALFGVLLAMLVARLTILRALGRML
jgi:cell division transport system permease protein